jgi:hypothetical protein
VTGNNRQHPSPMLLKNLVLSSFLTDQSGES